MKILNLFYLPSLQRVLIASLSSWQMIHYFTFV